MKLLICPLLGLLICFVQGQENKQAARKFDEYQLHFTHPAKEAARLVRYAKELKRSTSMKAYIMRTLRASLTVSARTTGTLPRIVAVPQTQSLLIITAYLTEMRGLAPERFAIMEGGYRENPMFEVWLVLGKGTRPSPTPSVDPRYVEFEGNSRKRRR